MTAINILRGEKDIRCFTAGETVFTEGSPGDGMYAVLDGAVDIILGNTVRETVRQGGVFGELALLDDHPRSARAVAQTDARVAFVNPKRFETLIQQSPFFALEVMQVMAERLRRNDSVNG